MRTSVEGVPRRNNGNDVTLVSIFQKSMSWELTQHISNLKHDEIQGE